jgi:uncharacterized protein (DUF1330 family)
MTAHVIFFVEKINDPAGLKAYQRAAHPTLEPAGGRVTIAYGEQEVVEGSPLAGVVMIEFPTYEAARAWYHSPGYTQAAAIRKAGAAECHAVIVQGKVD